jgi:hypothetical protein
MLRAREKLAPASEFAEGHILPFKKGHGLAILKLQTSNNKKYGDTA